ncbi:HUS1 (predicted) [Pycnogonum litorale]
MKFRAKMVEIMCIHLFTRVMQTISKLTKIIVMRLSPTKLCFVLNESTLSGGVSIWCEMNQGYLFDEYNMEGVSAEQNEIYLELNADNLVKAMKSAHSAKSVKIKLTRKHVPCITLEIELPSLSSNSRIVVHDIPVTVIPRRLWNEYQEPNMPDFDVSLYMAPIKVVKNVAERMKNLSQYVMVGANQDGEMTLSVETDQVTASTHFKDLPKPTWDDNQNEHTGKNEAKVKVDIKKLSHFLSGQQINPAKIICNIVDQKMLQFCHDSTTICRFSTYFISGMVS